MITIINKQRKISIDVKRITQLIEAMLDALDYSEFDVGIFFTTNKTIRDYNQKFRDKDKPTDVLSFPYYPELVAGERILAEHEDEKNLGDIIISLEYLKADAERLNKSFYDHLVVILAHGLAHLLNYDHQTDEEFFVMQKIEQKLLRAINHMSS